MVKRLQNKVSESRMALPITLCYVVGMWLMGGLIKEQLWLQFACFLLTTYLMVELNNSNALIRIYSRMVSVAFLMLSCMAFFLFPSLPGNFTQLCVVAACLVLFRSYQDKASAGLTYYGFVFVGLASLTFIHILIYVPILWALMLTRLQTLSWRTFLASLLGIITPYWLGSCWMIYQEDFTWLINHFALLMDFGLPFDFSILNTGQIATFAFLIVLAVIGTVHFWRTSTYDKIRIRQLFSIFIWIDFLTTIFICLQPQYFDMLIRIMIINTAPLIGHYIALTHTKVTNITFCVISIIALVLTGYNLWMSSSLF